MNFLWVVFLICSTAFAFSWNPPLASGLSVQTSINPNCIGGFDVTLDNVLYPCFGGSIVTTATEELCPNGLHGILLNGTLTCGVITEYIGAGQQGCVNGGYRFLSNTQNFTQCYGAQTYLINSTSDGLTIISSSAFSSTMLKSFTNSPSVTWFGTATSVSANAIITATDVTSGFASVLAGCSGNNCNYRQIRGADPSLINVQQDSTTVYITSNLKAQNLPCPNVSPLLFPDCANATVQSDINECLALRAKTATSSGLGLIPLIYATTITNTYFNDFSSSTPVITLFQSAGVIYIGLNIDGEIYSPAVPFRGLSPLSLRTIFDDQFNNVLPSVTGFWYVDPVNGDDSWSGAPNSPLRTIGKTFDLIVTFPFLQTQTVLLTPGYYSEGNLLWPPNTFVKSLGSMEDTLVVISGANVDLRSDWNTYANDIVEGGVQDVQWKCDKFTIDYAGVEGPSGGYSSSHFSFTRTIVDAIFTINGRGNTDHVDFLLSTVSQATTTNCLDMDITENSLLGDWVMNDSPCPVSDIIVNMQYNKFYEKATYVLKHSESSNFKIFVHFNSFPVATTTQFYGTPNVYANGLPLNVYFDPGVSLINDFNAKSVVMKDLPTPYFSSAQMNLDDIVLALSNYAKTITYSGSGASPIFSVSTTTVTMNGFAGTFFQLTVAASGGVLTFSIPSDFRAPGSLRVATNFYVSTSPAVSAAGTTQATATALTSDFNVVTTVTASSGVRLMTPVTGGASICIINRGLNILNVYPATGGQFNTVGVNVAVTIAVNGVGKFMAASTTQWYSI